MAPSSGDSDPPRRHLTATDHLQHPTCQTLRWRHSRTLTTDATDEPPLVTHDSITGSWCVYWFLHKHPTTKRKHSSIKSHSQHISIHSISYVWSNFTNRNGGNFPKAALSSYKLVDNLEATMIAICYQKHRIAFIEASFWNQTFIRLNKQKRFSRSIFIPNIRLPLQYRLDIDRALDAVNMTAITILCDSNSISILHFTPRNIFMLKCPWN